MVYYFIEIVRINESKGVRNVAKNVFELSIEQFALWSW